MVAVGAVLMVAGFQVGQVVVLMGFLMGHIPEDQEIRLLPLRHKATMVG
jgi:hypothetical protein